MGTNYAECQAGQAFELVDLWQDEWGLLAIANENIGFSAIGKFKPTFRTSKCSIKKWQSLSILRSQLGKNLEYFYSKLWLSYASFFNWDRKQPRKWQVFIPKKPCFFILLFMWQTEVRNVGFNHSCWCFNFLSPDHWIH